MGSMVHCNKFCKPHQAESVIHQNCCRYDTRLTSKGVQQAQHAREEARLLQPTPEVLLSSPLTRALHTAQLVFEGLNQPAVVEPLCSERLWLSSDVGRQPEELQVDFPDVDFTMLKRVWWHSNSSGDTKHVQPESEGGGPNLCELSYANIAKLHNNKPCCIKHNILVGCGYCSGAVHSRSQSIKHQVLQHINCGNASSTTASGQLLVSMCHILHGVLVSIIFSACQ